MKENKAMTEEKNNSVTHDLKSTLITKEEVLVKFNLIEKSLQNVEGKLQKELQSLKDDLMSVDTSDNNGILSNKDGIVIDTPNPQMKPLINTPTTSDIVSSNNISITIDSPDKVTGDQYVKMPMQTKFENPQPVTERYHFQRRQAKPVDFLFS